jgi:hypothetical protein
MAVVSLATPGRCKSQSFPRKRESTPQTSEDAVSTDWIPAFAGMTAAGSSHVCQMTPPPPALDTLPPKAYTIVNGTLSARAALARLEPRPSQGAALHANWGTTRGRTSLTPMRMPALLKLMLDSEFGQGPCSAARFSLTLRWPILLLCAHGALSAACWASEARTPSAGQLPATPSFCDQGCAIADLDGDGRPDLAVARAEGWGPSGFQYRIDLDLTTRVGLSSFSVSAQSGGLRIIPRDVNGDWDLDLVITSAWSFTPVGVWINDGHGGFTRGDPTAYPQSTWDEGPGILMETPHEIFQATVPGFSRSWPDSPEGPSFCNELLIKRLTPLLADACAPSGAPRRPQTRGPPFPLSQQPR